MNMFLKYCCVGHREAYKRFPRYIPRPIISEIILLMTSNLCKLFLYFHNGLCKYTKCVEVCIHMYIYIYALLKYLRGKFLLIIGWILGTFYIFIWYFMTYNSMIQGPNKMSIQRHRLAAEGRWNLHWKSRENTAIANTLSRFGKHFKLGTLLWCRKGSLSLCGTFCTKCFQETSFKTTSTWVRFLNSKDNLRWPW